MMRIDSLRKKEKDLFLRIGAVTKEEARDLLKDLGTQAKNIEYEEDYAWINEAVVRWETYLKSEYGQVYVTPIGTPRRVLKKHVGSVTIPFLPLHRPLAELFAHFLMTEPSSGRVAVAFADLITHVSEGVGTLDAERKRIIINLAKLAQQLRPSLTHFAGSVISKLDDLQVLRTNVSEFLDEERLLSRKVGIHFKSSLEMLGIGPGRGILIHGFSQLMQPTLKAIPEQWRREIKVFVSECQFARQRADGWLGFNVARDLGFSGQLVSQDQISQVIDDSKISATIMGCRAVGRDSSDAVEVTNMQGSAGLCKLARQRGVLTCFLLGKRKIIAAKSYREMSMPVKVEAPRLLSLVSSRWLILGETGIPQQDRIKEAYIDFLATEDGVYTVEQFAQAYAQQLSE